MKIKFLWVWGALAPNLLNTHFLIEDRENRLQVDCGWGMTLAQKIRKKEIYFEDIFITHVHTDHILGFFNMLRTITVEIPKLNVYCSKKVENDIRTISKIVLKKGINDFFDNGIVNFINIDDLENKKIWEFSLKPINLNSIKMEQYWFLLEHKNKKILFFWDEAFRVMQRDDLEKLSWIDYLICEALVPENFTIKDWWKMDIDKTHHITARQAWRIASKLKAKNLIIIHTKEIENRQELLKNDAKKVFDWNIIVPNDGDEIELI